MRPFLCRRRGTSSPLNRSAGILPAYDGKSPAMAKSKQSTHRNPNPPSQPQAGAPTSGSGAQIAAFRGPWYLSRWARENRSRRHDPTHIGIQLGNIRVLPKPPAAVPSPRREKVRMRIRPTGISRFEPLNRSAKNVAQASSPAGSTGVPPGVFTGGGTPPQLAAETDCATRFMGG